MAKFMSLLQLLFFVAAYGSGEFAARFAERSGMQPLAAQLYMVTPTWTWGVALFALHGWSPFTARVLALAQLFAGGVASMRGIQPTSRTQQRYLTYPIIGSISGVALSTVVGLHANGMVALLGVMLHVFSCIHEVVWRVILPAPIVAEFANVPYLQARHEQRPNVALFSIASSGSPGVTISGAIAKAPEQFGRPPRILLYLGGNAELWEHSLVPIAAFANKRLGADAVLLNYRGVGTSGGVTRTAEGMAVDASDVIKYLLASTPGLLESDILLFGHSIGGGVAAIVVDKYHRQCSVVLDRTFSTLPDAAKGVVPRLPLSLIRPVVALALGTMDSNSRWQRIQHERKLVTFHRSDRVINFGLASLARSADFQQGAARRFVVELRGDSGDAHNGDLLEFEGAIEAVQRMASFYRP